MYCILPKTEDCRDFIEKTNQVLTGFKNVLQRGKYRFIDG